MTIESNIPLPPKTKSGRKKSATSMVAILQSMKSGDSMEIDPSKAGSWYAASNKAGVPITFRSTEDGGKRFWVV